jgi:acyl carrier protein
MAASARSTEPGRMSIHERTKSTARYSAPGPSDDQECTVPAETHVEQGPMSRQEVFELVRDRLADILETDPGGINEGDSFADDLGADSLALIELVEELEEELGERSVGFRIEDEDLEDLKTVRDAVDYVFEKLAGK